MFGGTGVLAVFWSLLAQLLAQPVVVAVVGLYIGIEVGVYVLQRVSFLWQNPVDNIHDRAQAGRALFARHKQAWADLEMEQYADDWDEGPGKSLRRA